MPHEPCDLPFGGTLRCYRGVPIFRTVRKVCDRRLKATRCPSQYATGAKDEQATENEERVS